MTKTTRLMPLWKKSTFADRIRRSLSFLKIHGFISDSAFGAAKDKLREMEISEGIIDGIANDARGSAAEKEFMAMLEGLGANFVTVEAEGEE